MGGFEGLDPGTSEKYFAEGPTYQARCDRNGSQSTAKKRGGGNSRDRRKRHSDCKGTGAFSDVDPNERYKSEQYE
jgi:hypothetical protein